jgi:hypothetical protein
MRRGTFLGIGRRRHYFEDTFDRYMPPATSPLRSQMKCDAKLKLVIVRTKLSTVGKPHGFVASISNRTIYNATISD